MGIPHFFLSHPLTLLRAADEKRIARWLTHLPIGRCCYSMSPYTPQKPRDPPRRRPMAATCFRSKAPRLPVAEAINTNQTSKLRMPLQPLGGLFRLILIAGVCRDDSPSGNCGLRIAFSYFFFLAEEVRPGTGSSCLHEPIILFLRHYKAPDNLNSPPSSELHGYSYQHNHHHPVCPSSVSDLHDSASSSQLSLKRYCLTRQ